MWFLVDVLDEGITRISFCTSNTPVDRELGMSFVGTTYLFAPIFDVSTALRGFRGLYRYDAMSISMSSTLYATVDARTRSIDSIHTRSLNARIQPCFDAMDRYNNLGSRSIQPWSYDDDYDDDDDRSRIANLVPLCRVAGSFGEIFI